MIITLSGLVAAAAALASSDELVEISSINPRIRLDIRYATTNNFTLHQLYPMARCYLRRATAEKLSAVQRDLEKEGLGLKVFDGYRPRSVQKQLWAAWPDGRFVASPAKGSRHNRGTAVDVTLVTVGGVELPMPTSFDDFSEKARRDFMDLPPQALANRQRLERAMVKHGFAPLATEWWHFDDVAWEKYELLDVDFSTLALDSAATPRRNRTDVRTIAE